MKNYWNKGVLAIVGLCVVLAVSAWAQSDSTGPDVDPSAVQQRAGSAPPASAKTADSIGGSAVNIATANHGSDTDSFWVQSIDIDGDGNVEEADLLWDDEDKILFAYEEGTFTCANGGTGSGELLIGVNAAGNTRNRAAGSGFWLADLDESECDAEAEAMWGCRFDADGDPTECGIATLDDETDELVIVVVQS